MHALGGHRRRTSGASTSATSCERQNTRDSRCPSWRATRSTYDSNVAVPPLRTHSCQASGSWLAEVSGDVDDVHLRRPEAPDDAGDLVLVGVGEQLVRDEHGATAPVARRLGEPVPGAGGVPSAGRGEVEHVEDGVEVAGVAAEVAGGVEHAEPGEPATVAGQGVAQVRRAGQRGADVQHHPGRTLGGGGPEPSHGPIIAQPRVASVDLLPVDVVARLRSALEDAGFTYDGVAELLGRTAHAALSRNETTPGLRATAGGRPLATLTRLWPLQAVVAVADAERALPGLVDAAVRRGGARALPRVRSGRASTCGPTPTTRGTGGWPAT